jgi:hypothetical protein
MTRIVSLAVFALLLGSSPGRADDPFAGKWVNVDEMTRGLTRLEIEKKGDAWVIRAWGKCHPTDCDWGKVTLHLLGDSVSDKQMKHGLAQWDHKFKDSHLTLRLEQGELVVVSFDVFKDGSGRSNYRSTYKFKKGK